MALKGFLLAWLTVMLAFAVWIYFGVANLFRHPMIAETMNWTAALAVIWWVRRVDRVHAPADRDEWLGGDDQ